MIIDEMVSLYSGMKEMHWPAFAQMEPPAQLRYSVSLQRTTQMGSVVMEALRGMWVVFVVEVVEV